MIGARQLAYFQAVARELHFTRAAQVLRVAQPALSQQIRKLERQLGVALFERDNHRVALTPAGAALLGHADRVLADLAAIEEEMLGWAGGTRGRIRLGTAQGIAIPLVRLLAAFSSAFPQVEVELLEENTEAMLAGLQAGNLDAATLAGPPAPTNDRLCTYPLGVEPLTLMVAPDSPLAGRAEVPVAELDGVELVLFRPGSAIREVLLAALAEAGARPKVRFETRSHLTARALASVGLAAAIVPASLATGPGQPVVAVRLSPSPTWTPMLAWSATRRPTPALTAFLDYVRAHPKLASVCDIENVSP